MSSFHVTLPDLYFTPFVSATVTVNVAAAPVAVLSVRFSVTATENIEKLEDTVNDDIVDVLKRVPGVGTAEAFGGLQRQINVFLDPAKLSAHGLSVAAIAAAIDADNQTEPAGNVKIGTVDYTIRVPGEFATPEEVGLVVVKRDGDKVVRVSDVARVEDGFAEETRVVERMGRAGMMVDVQKRSGENTMAVARRVMDKLEEIKANLPADYSIDLVFDTSDMIGKSIRSVGRTVMWGGLFVVLVTLFFLRSARTSLVIALTIPFSLIIASVFMFLKGWTINLMSESESAQKMDEERRVIRELFVERLDVDAELADILIDEGFTTLEEIAYVPLAEMQEIEELDDDTINELRERARNVLLTEAIATEEQIENVSEELLALPGMEKTLAAKLAQHGVTTRDGLADFAVDELVELTGVDEERAANLIREARAHWFEE